MRGIWYALCRVGGGLGGCSTFVARTSGMLGACLRCCSSDYIRFRRLADGQMNYNLFFVKVGYVMK